MSRRLVAALVVAVLALGTAVFVTQTSAKQRILIAEFSRTTSLYAGANVKVLGVTVGSVKSITVKGTHVDVEMSYDETVPLPADVHALVVPPSHRG